MRRRVLMLCSLTATLAVVTGSPALAAGQNGVAEWDEFVFAFNSEVYELNNGPTGPHGNGSESDFSTQKKDLAGYDFLSLGAGRGQAVKNNSAHVFNLDARDARVFFNSYAVMGCWCGVNDFAPGYTERDLSNTKNDNASFRWYPIPGTPV